MPNNEERPMQATVVGAGLAGCEAAWQLAQRGIQVTLYEMKPTAYTPAHKSQGFAELVCSNSLRSDRLQNAVGLLKEELRRFGSLILQAADATRVPAGGALAVDREGFSRFITQAIQTHPNITVEHTLVEEIPKGPVVIATGPLTQGPINDAIAALLGDTGRRLHFYDAAAPVITKESLDFSIVFPASRYGRGGEDYLNCPMTREEYFRFYQALIGAETAPLHAHDQRPKVFEGCMPIEIMAQRGEMTLCFGPLKPVGLEDAQGNRPFAVVQLRQDDAAGTLYNMVGFQTNLKFGEQKRVFSMIPGMEQAEFVRYGVMHRNTFLESPGILGWDYQMVKQPGVYFAGQMTGVEGYVESASSGFVAGVNLARSLQGQPPLDFTRQTAMGALAHYVSEYNGGDFQPMNATYGIMEPLSGKRIRNKQERYTQMAQRSLSLVDTIVEDLKRNC